MRILLLADTNSSHIQKWVTSLADSGLEIGVFTFSENVSTWMDRSNIQVFYAPSKYKANGRTFSKILYLRNIFFLKKCIREFMPDIVHAHYATSYGLLGSLTGFRPFIISVWGSDILDFPAKSFIHSYILRSNLKRASAICVTSKALADMVHSISGIVAYQIPFGINTNEFKSLGEKTKSDDNEVVIGTIKSLEVVYRIDLLLTAFAEVRLKFPDLKLKLLIVGSGSLLDELKAQAFKLNIDKDLTFTGKVAYEEVLSYHNIIDIFVNVSDYESFGVSVLESSACEKPVIASNTGGLKEVVVNNKTGYLTEPGNAFDLAEKLESLIAHKQLRTEMGRNGRLFVQENYEWKHCVIKMKSIYSLYFIKH